jgi:hypothetical protein
MDNFFDWEMLSTVAGAALVVWVVIEALKSAIGPSFSQRAQSITTLLLSISLMIIFTVLNTTNIWGDYVLAVLNGTVVYLAVKQMSNTTMPNLRKTLQARKEK